MNNNKQKKSPSLISSQRSSPDEIINKKNKIRSHELFVTALDTLLEKLLIIDQNRQIVYLNKAILKFLKTTDSEEIYGLRPGEIFYCKNAKAGSDGCGTTPQCQVCGLLNAVINTLNQNTESECEYRLTQENGETIELNVSTIPIKLDGEKFIRIAMSDISHEKRRIALERIFFHDILNIAGGIHGISSILNECDSNEKIKEFTEMILLASNSLIDEINAQKQLQMAERKELKLNIETLESSKIISDLLKIYSRHEVSIGKTITIINSESVIFRSDKTILNRVLGNMLKNALEAIKSGNEVKIGCNKISAGELEFYVSNPSFIPYEAQLQIFQRSFSTKGEDRGLGTYSIKLLGERYLKGQVGFKSEENTGTSFFIKLKLDIIPV